jgi:23S rRNA (uracil1939-C5)-methyltransferase
VEKNASHIKDLCTHSEQCGGCPLGAKSHDDQIINKISTIETALGRFSIDKIVVKNHPIPNFGLRNRLDLVVVNGQYCLGSATGSPQKWTSITDCPMSTNAVRTAFKWLLEHINFPVKIGSLRIRVGPTGCKGIWLDFSNLDIKDLLSNNSLCSKLYSYFEVIEVGQKRKKLSLLNSDWKLTDPEYNYWSDTFLNSNSPINLYGLVGGFTQAGPDSIRLICQSLNEILSQIKPTQSIEFGSGIGTLTLPLVHHTKDKVNVFELDEHATMGLRKTLQENRELESRIDFHVGDFRLKANLDGVLSADLVLLNPPRSGVGGFLNAVFDYNLKPSSVVYMSCHLDSLVKDAKTLWDQGYSIQEIHLIDQFPNTPHFETITWWKQP